jgi:large subunit ribosomal protein L1
MSGKKYANALKQFDRDQFYGPVEALGLAKTMASAKFDEGVDVSIRLGVDPRKADQMVRGTVALPAGTGKDIRVAVFATGEAADEARAAGADIVGADDLATEVEGGKMDFDLVIATPDMMPVVGRLGRVLGPRGLMPNPKTGTVTPDVGKAVEDFKGGKVEYRTDRYGNVHVPLGKVSFEPAALEQNFRAVIDEIQRAKPASAKGRYLKKITAVVHDGSRHPRRHGPAASPNRWPEPKLPVWPYPSQFTTQPVARRRPLVLPRYMSGRRMGLSRQPR